jgi:hypothetical protein
MKSFIQNLGQSDSNKKNLIFYAIVEKIFTRYCINIIIRREIHLIIRDVYA